MYNKVILMGRITKEIELKTTQSGREVTSFSIAVDRAYQPNKEERKADFHNIVAWGNTAVFISNYFDKGKMILVEGELQNRKYTDKNGVERTVTEIIADHASFTGEKKESGGTTYPAPPAPPTQKPTQTTASEFVVAGESDDDTYPF